LLQKRLGFRNFTTNVWSSTPYQVCQGIMEILQRLTSLKQELDELRPLNSETEAAIMQKFRLDWNFHSNNLEGNTLTYGETRALLLSDATSGKSLMDHNQMVGHNKAIKWIHEIIDENGLMTEQFIRELNELILYEPHYKKAKTPDGQSTKKLIRVGEYKKEPNHVETVTGEMFYFATPEETPAKMHDLIEWYRAKKEELHPLLLAAEFHYKFIRIHPFDDGNGRTARLLMNFILMQNAYPPVVIRTDDKENYFAVLRQADAGNLEPFIEYIGENLEHSLTLMLKGARGESIDEPDDVDKEIALLERRLEGYNPKNVLKKTSKIVAYTYENSIRDLLLLFLENSEKFKRFYSFYSYRYQCRFDEQNKTDCTLQELNDIILSKKYDIDFVNLWISFRGFKHHKLPDLDYSGTYLNIKFRESDYIIEPFLTRKDHQIRKYYDELLSQEEAYEIVRAETKRHSSTINGWLNKYDSKK